MHYQVAVQITDRGAHFEEQPNLVSRTAIRDVDIDGLAFDILHHQVRLPILTMTGIEKTRNVRVGERRQNLPLGEKSRANLRIVGSRAQKFYGDSLRKLAVHALC